MTSYTSLQSSKLLCNYASYSLGRNLCSN